MAAGFHTPRDGPASYRFIRSAAARAAAPHRAYADCNVVGPTLSLWLSHLCRGQAIEIEQRPHTIALDQPLGSDYGLVVSARVPAVFIASLKVLNHHQVRARCCTLSKQDRLAIGRDGQAEFHVAIDQCQRTAGAPANSKNCSGNVPALLRRPI